MPGLFVYQILLWEAVVFPIGNYAAIFNSCLSFRLAVLRYCYHTHSPCYCQNRSSPKITGGLHDVLHL